MAGKFERRPFAEIDFKDPFFDSLKCDYPGTKTSTSFTAWFEKKTREGQDALIFTDKNGIGAFISVKPNEVEALMLEDGQLLPKKPRFKISTIKIAERYQNVRIGEGALGLILWQWRDSKAEEIYVTVFEKQHTLIELLKKYGFVYVGKNRNGECLYLKNRRQLDFSDPCHAFPFINGALAGAGCLAINMEYHDTMFAYSELANTLQQKVDISVANGLKKVYIGSPVSLGFQSGEPVLIYRKYTGKIGKPSFKSCLTSYCIATNITWVKKNGKGFISDSDFLHLAGNKSVFDSGKLITYYEQANNLALIELLYCGYFGAGNNINWWWLKDHGYWPGSHPMNFRYSMEQLKQILREGHVDVDNVIVN